ncbi:MAG: hypothetical protein HUU21_28350 [Polyangiaceae bacterium]|nr:hypothetical protein [Polyangiaceae bacterium]
MARKVFAELYFKEEPGRGGVGEAPGDVAHFDRGDDFIARAHAFRKRNGGLGRGLFGGAAGGGGN